MTFEEFRLREQVWNCAASQDRDYYRNMSADTKFEIACGLSEFVEEMGWVELMCDPKEEDLNRQMWGEIRMRIRELDSKPGR